MQPILGQTKHRILQGNVLSRIKLRYVENIYDIPLSETRNHTLVDGPLLSNEVCHPIGVSLGNIYIRFGTKLYRQIVGIPIGTNCAPLVADLFLFCYERDFMKTLSSDNQADVIKAFNLTSRYLDDLLNIDNLYFEGMVNQIYPPEL